MGLRDEVFRGRDECFHWNLSCSVEAYETLNHLEIEAGEEEDEDIRGVGSMFEDEGSAGK